MGGEKREEQTVQEASAPSFRCLAVTSASLLSVPSLLIGPEEEGCRGSLKGKRMRRADKMRGFQRFGTIWKSVLEEGKKMMKSRWKQPQT